jgi:dephospho-CoA kinase
MKKDGGATPLRRRAPAPRAPAAERAAAARPKVLRVGLTGGIGTGKSTVARHFESFGAAVLDADAVAHRLIEPGSPGHQPVIDVFGRTIVRGDGSIDRKALGKIVFADPAQRKRLEAILHPLIQVEEDGFVARIGAGGLPRIVVINAALLFEAGTWKNYDRVVVAHCDESVQIDRVVERDRVSREAAAARLAAQMPTSEKVRQSHYAIDTTDGFEATEDQSRAVWQHLETDLAALAG